MLGELGLTRVQKQQRIIERLDAAYYLGRALETKSEKDIKNALKFAKVVGFRWTSEVWFHHHHHHHYHHHYSYHYRHHYHHHYHHHQHYNYLHLHDHRNHYHHHHYHRHHYDHHK